ncbi:MAG: phage portal protein [Acetobacteraceae bacterium]
MWPFRRSQRTLERELGRILLDRAEARSSPEDPRIPLSSPEAFSALFGSWRSAAGVEVTPERALGVPAVWCAVNFIAGTIASLPLITYTRDAEGNRRRADGDPIYWLLHDEVNAELQTSFAWRKYSMVNTLLRGRSVSFIERNRIGRPTNLWPLNPLATTVERVGGRKQYRYRDGAAEHVYAASEVIDIPFMLCVDGISAEAPTSRLRNSLGLAIAIEDYAATFFRGGGVPPLAMQMPDKASPAAGTRAAANIDELIRDARSDGRLVLPLPTGHRLEQIGFNPEAGQLVEARRLQVEEIARMFMLPPIFLQELTRANFANSEQQDLHFVKHTLTQWLECWEQELNAKLFGPRSRNFVEFNVDGLLRGDFATRMAGYATGIQNAIITPDEARDSENRPRMGGEAAKLHVQGATVPLGEQTRAVGTPSNAPIHPPAQPAKASDK